MIRGIYTAAAGMVAETTRNDTIANNLANINTAGYKKDVSVTRNFKSMLVKRIADGPEEEVGRVGTGAEVQQNYTLHQMGIMQPSGNSLDMAIDGKGFFTVETPAGLRYTRSGAFSRDAAGTLVTSEGYPVMGQNGLIRLEEGAISISSDGSLYVDGQQTDQLQLADFVDYQQLIKQGNSLFQASPTAGSVPVAAGVRQGFLELSNVNTVTEMVDMIAGYRAYEVNAKVVQIHDQLLDKAVNEVGRV